MTEQNKPHASIFAVGQTHSAVTQPDGSFKIYDSEGDLRFTLPAGTPFVHIPLLTELIERELKNSFNNGREAGIYYMQKQLRALIGAAEAE